jgi:hypothetical protein
MPAARPALDVPLQIQGLPEMRTDPNDGTYSRTGVAPGVWSVTATDPQTGFKKSETVTLPDGEGQDAAVDIVLPAYGAIAGVVLRANGQPAFGVRVQLGLAEATTGIGGHFTFQNVAVDVQHTLVATDTSGDRGLAVVRLATHGEVFPASITLNGLGAVEVVVLTAGGAPASGAIVDLSSGPGWAESKPTNSLGKASFSNVLAGSIRAAARDSRGATGEQTSFLQPDGLLALTVDLRPVARVQGQVRRSDGLPASGVTVEISGVRTGSVSSDGAGNFAFENVPAGHFQLVATDAAAEDHGFAEGDVVGEDTLTLPVSLIGTGAVEATVRDGSGNPVKDAKVDVSWTGRFAATRSAFTNESGVAVVGKVIAGAVSVSARKDTLATNLVSVSVPPGGSVPVTLGLEGAATARGVVYEPDASTPAQGARVGIGVGNPSVFLTTGDDGVYEFPDLRLNVEYSLFVYRNDRLRALGTVRLTQQGQVGGPDLTLVGVGTVTGMLRDAAGVPVLAHPVSLTSLVPIFGGIRTVKTDLAGNYTVDDVPVGGSTVGFTLVATRGADRADGAGKIQFHGQTFPLDLRFLPSAVTLPRTLYDGNQWPHLFSGGDGRLDAGGNCIIFGGAAGQGGALRLSLLHQGQTLPFAGSGMTVETEENTRELIFRGTLAGLEVTRKVFVPRYGYFARTLDTFENDTDAPVTVDVQYDTDSNAWRPDVVGSASGWLALDDATQGGTGCQFPALAFAFGHQGSAASFSATHDRTASTARFTTRWGSLTIPAHSSLAMMQALSPQTTRARCDGERRTLERTAAGASRGADERGGAGDRELRGPGRPLEHTRAPSAAGRRRVGPRLRGRRNDGSSARLRDVREPQPALRRGDPVPHSTRRDLSRHGRPGERPAARRSARSLRHRGLIRRDRRFLRSACRGRLRRSGAVRHAGPDARRQRRGRRARPAQRRQRRQRRERAHRRTGRSADRIDGDWLYCGSLPVPGRGSRGARKLHPHGDASARRRDGSDERLCRDRQREERARPRLRRVQACCRAPCETPEAFPRALR